MNSPNANPLSLSRISSLKPSKPLAVLLMVLLLVVATSVQAHEGRRFWVEIVNDQLVSRGSIGGGVDDGGGVERPYYNSIHDHWTNSVGAKIEANASLPAWAIIDHSPLVGHSVHLEFINTFKWVDPPLMPEEGTVPNFVSLDQDELITIKTIDETITSDSLGVLELVNSVDVHGHFNLQFDYQINKKPSQEIMVMEWILSTSAPGVSDSSSVYTILSPDGLDPVTRLHHASLYTERHLGVFNSVPEPGSACLLGLGLVAMAFRRNRK